jgi:hypothetical protein
MMQRPLAKANAVGSHRPRCQLWDLADLVETMGLEPTTSCLQSRCSSQLSYVPVFGNHHDSAKAR